MITFTKNVKYLIVSTALLKRLELKMFKIHIFIFHLIKKKINKKFPLKKKKKKRYNFQKVSS